MFFCNVENATRSQGKASGKRNPKTANALQLVWIYVWMCLKEKPVLSHKAMAGACLIAAACTPRVFGCLWDALERTRISRGSPNVSTISIATPSLSFPNVITSNFHPPTAMTPPTMLFSGNINNKINIEKLRKACPLLMEVFLSSHSPCQSLCRKSAHGPKCKEAAHPVALAARIC